MTNTAFTKDLLYYVLIHTDREVLLHSSPDIIERKFYKLLLEDIIRYLELYNNLPTIEGLLSFIESKYSITDYQSLKAVLETIKEHTPTIDRKALLDIIAKEKITKHIDKNLPALVESAKDKDLDSFFKTLSKIEKETGAYNKIPSKIQDRDFNLDKVVMVEPFVKSMAENGLFFTGVSVIGSGSGFGKSIFLLNQLLYTYNAGDSVCLLNLELGWNETISRLYSLVTDTPFKDVYTSPIAGIEEKVNKWQKDFFNKPNSFYMDNGSYTKEELIKVIKVYAQKGVKLFAIDYLNLVDLQTSGKDEWRALTSLIKDLHKLTQDLGIVIITPTQINMLDLQEKDNDIRITTRGSRELEFSASVLLVLYRTKEEFENNTMRVFTIKARNAQKGVYVLNTEFKYMKFTDTGLIL